MTIHSDWSRLLHSECPQAFLPQIPKDEVYGVGVIDGHLQLMMLHSGLGTLDRFLLYLFVNPIKKLFAAGCPTVVLCFDSYDTVPIYKSMTQHKRASKTFSCDFVAGDDLPTSIPQNDTMSYLMNRHFKLKVIDLACSLVPGMVVLGKGQKLIVDYKRVVEYEAGALTPRTVEGMVPTGESDIKFARYVDLYGNALVHAIDGDYMAIALLYYAMRGMKHKIFIFRQLAQLAPTAAERRQAEAKQPKKRKQDDEATKARKKTPKCWVDMQLLFITIAQSVRQSVRQTSKFFIKDEDAVHAAVVLMLCAGTDFSRPMPLIGPKRIWEGLPIIADTLLLAAPRGRPIDYTLFADGVIAPLYKSVFANHVSTGATLSEVVMRLQRGSSLSKTTTDRLPSDGQMLTTLKNVNWVANHYWIVVNGPIEAPMDGSNGFVFDDKQKVVYEDCA